MSTTGAARSVVRRVRAWMPEGRGLAEPMWVRRHAGILALLWAHALAVPVFALARGYGVAHSLAEGAVVPAAAVVATFYRRSRRVRSTAASVGLLSASAVLVHLSGGVIEMHFHFFVMVAVISLYQDWLPFLAAVLYVLVHHGLVGSLDPGSVYNHPAAMRAPWLFAGIHALFIAGISAACLVVWRLDETMRTELRVSEKRAWRERWVVEQLNDIGKTLAGASDLREIMQRVTEAATELTGAQFGAFFHTVTNDEGTASLHTAVGASEEELAELGLAMDAAPVGPPFDGTEPVRVDDLAPRGRPGVRSYLAVPVRTRVGTALGRLVFGHRKPGQFSEDDERLAVGIANHAAIAIETARSFDSERQALDAARTALAEAEHARARLAVLAEAGRAMSSSLDVDEVLARLASAVVPEIADTCMIYLVGDDGQARLAAGNAIASVDEVAGAMSAPSEEVRATPTGPFLAAMESGQPVVYEEITDEFLAHSISDPDHLELVRRVAPTSAAVIPIVGRVGVLGAIVPGTVAQSGRRISATDVDLTEDLARRAAAAIENGRLYAAQRGTAETLQQSLLPERLAEVPGVNAAARYVAGGPGAQVGGDWYDLFVVPDGSVAIVMGDTVGHGIPAAALMGQVRNALRALALEGLDPAMVVERVNRILHDVGPLNSMLTLLYCSLDPESGRLRVVNAGHPPPLVLTAGGPAAYFEDATGIPLGATSRATYREAVTTLAPSQSLLLYTDGLVEERRKPIDHGLERLRAALDGRDEDAEALCQRALATMPEFRTVEDDIAVLAVRFMALGSHLTLHVPARPTKLKPLRSALTRWLRDGGIDSEELFPTLVACTEACTNAIRYGCPPDGAFEVSGELGERIVLRVTSPGPWRERSSEIGGRGLPIMREYMDEVEVHCTDAGVEVVMERALTSNGRSR